MDTKLISKTQSNNKPMLFTFWQDMANEARTNLLIRDILNLFINPHGRSTMYLTDEEIQKQKE